MGVGHFFGLMPEFLLPGCRRTGVELDGITARIAKQLYPDATIFAKGFEETHLPDNFFDAVIGNPPFMGGQKITGALGAPYRDYLVGYIAAGSITRRHTRCGNLKCRCHGDPPRMHGPYWQWTAKIEGKTVTRRLSQSEAELYQEWIANDRQLRAIITQMRQVAGKATELTMKEVKNKSAKV